MKTVIIARNWAKVVMALPAPALPPYTDKDASRGMGPTDGQTGYAGYGFITPAGLKAFPWAPIDANDDGAPVQRLVRVMRAQATEKEVLWVFEAQFLTELGLGPEARLLRNVLSAIWPDFRGQIKIIEI